MTKMTSVACAAVMAAFAATSIVPATAAPIFVPQNSYGATDVIQVQDGYKWRKKNVRKGSNWQGDNFRRDGNHAWYNGKRGYRYKRDGYQYHNGFWFPAGVFVVGALVGSAIANSNNSYAGGSAHVEWCYDRYRSYRAYDNTFQPYNGARQQCYSPYS